MTAGRLGRRLGIAAALGAGALALAAGSTGRPAMASTGDGGQATFTNCMACHGREGQGGIAPPFAGNPNLADDAAVLSRILDGSPTMPPFDRQLDDAEIAGVVNYIRARWPEGRSRALRPEDVAAARRNPARAGQAAGDAMTGGQAPW